MCCIVSVSPERFLRWSGIRSVRPIDVRSRRDSCGRRDAWNPVCDMAAAPEAEDKLVHLGSAFHFRPL